MSIQNILLILAAGTAGGFINTMAGGGSIITLPLLIFLGLPSAVANGTNRIALMVENLTAVSNFKSRGYSNFSLSIKLGIPAVAGSIIGSRLAINLPDELFNQILAVVMFIMLGLILWNPTEKFTVVKENLSFKRQLAASTAFFFVGIYGGFVQAGVGIIIIAALSIITGLSLIKINSIKVLVVAIYMLSSLLVFILNDKVNWTIGLTLAIGNGFGAWLASTLAVQKGDKLIKIILSFAVIMMALNLLGIF
ncbi:MAG: sulfite exporter TauE/SafE family protein [Halanaerobium sp.]